MGRNEGRRTWRFYVCWVSAVLSVILLFFHGTSPDSREYVKSLVGKPKPAISAEDAFTDPLATGLIDTPTEKPAGLDTPSDIATTTAPTEDANNGGWAKDKLFFENEVPYDMPSYDVAKLRKLSPHNYRGPGHKAFATFFISRNSSLHDAYYVATHEVIYRLLWNEASKSHRHPVVVFVPPFVTDEQRAYFEAAGAMVREVAQLPFEPNAETTAPVPSRFKDVFSKLEMWNQTDFSRIAFLDSDAFPLVNIDALLGAEMAPDLKCKPDLLKEEDRRHVSEGLCDYVFTGVRDGVMPNMINAGVMVLKPNAAMHQLLIQEYQENILEDSFPEQALLADVFREDGPFPATYISEAWNGDPQVKDDGKELYILHAKIWAWLFFDHWVAPLFGQTWNNSKTFYESDAFVKIRERDQALFQADHGL